MKFAGLRERGGRSLPASCRSTSTILFSATSLGVSSAAETALSAASSAGLFDLHVDRRHHVVGSSAGACRRSARPGWCRRSGRSRPSPAAVGRGGTGRTRLAAAAEPMPATMTRPAASAVNRAAVRMKTCPPSVSRRDHDGRPRVRRAAPRSSVPVRDRHRPLRSSQPCRPAVPATGNRNCHRPVTTTRHAVRVLVSQLSLSVGQHAFRAKRLAAASGAA